MQTKVVERLAVVVGDWEARFGAWVMGRKKVQSTRTAEAYCQDVRVFSRWFEAVNGQPFEPALTTGVDLRAWAGYSMEVEQAAPATWNRRRATMSVFCEWLVATGQVTYNPFADVPVAEEVELPPRWLTREEDHAFLRTVEKRIGSARTEAARRQARRDWAVVALMRWAGLREAEVCALDLGDVQVGERKGRVVVRLGKGKKRREVPLNSEARRALRLWLEVRPVDLGEALFFGKRRVRLGVNAVQELVAGVRREARLGEDVTPHALRHTFAQRVVDREKRLDVAADLLGHEDLATTRRYTKPGWEDFERAVEGV